MKGHHMFAKKSSTPEIDGLITSLYDDLCATDSGSKEYADKVDQLIKLAKLKDESVLKRVVSPDTLALVAGNLAGILLIVGHERAHVVTSKALSFVMKAR